MDGWMVVNICMYAEKNTRGYKCFMYLGKGVYIHGVLLAYHAAATQNRVEQAPYRGRGRGV